MIVSRLRRLPDGKKSLSPCAATRLKRRERTLSPVGSGRESSQERRTPQERFRWEGETPTESRTLENPNTSLSDPAAWLWSALGARTSSTGASVSAESALEISAVWAAVRAISSTIATLLELRRNAPGRDFSVSGAPAAMVDLATMYGVAELLGFKA